MKNSTAMFSVAGSLFHRSTLRRGLLYAWMPCFKRFWGVEKVRRNSIEITVDLWRRRIDSNSRAGCPTYALSRGASSPTWVLLHTVLYLVLNRCQVLSSKSHAPCVIPNGGESGIRTHGALRHDGFQDRSVMTTLVPLRLCFDIIAYPGGPCQAKKWKNTVCDRAEKFFQKMEKGCWNFQTDVL